MPESDVVLPVPARLSPVRDDHAWHFPDISGHRVHVRLRVWPTKEGGHLVVATDLGLGAGLINAAESLVRAARHEFGEDVTAVRHFPPHSMTAFERDTFDVLLLDDKGVARPRRCTAQVLRLLGASVVGFPGDAPPGPTDATAPIVPPQSVHLARLTAAALRLTQSRATERQPNGYPTQRGPVAEPDLDAISQLRITAPVLQHLAHFIATFVVDHDGTAAGAKREKKLERIIDALNKQAWALTELCDDLVDEERDQAT
ncbi:hypothetical protein [Streptomyces mayteni]